MALSPRKLLLSKWTAVEPRRKEKHFIVTKVHDPEEPGGPVTDIELEAVHSKRSYTLHWRELGDTAKWRQGWV